MADADVPITAGAGTKIDTRTVGAGTDEHRQVVVVGDPTTAANVGAVSAAGRLSVDASGVAVPVTDNAGSLTVDQATAANLKALADQGTAAATAGAWPAKVTDGTNVGAVKAASTPAVAADPALVVAINPGTPVVIKEDQPAATTATWTSATSLNTAATATVTNYASASISIQTPTTVTAGVITLEVSDDAGTTYYPAGTVRVENGQQEYVVTLALTPGIVLNRTYQVGLQGFTNLRARLSTVIVGAGNTLVRISPMGAPAEKLVSVRPRMVATYAAGYRLAVATAGTTYLAFTFAANTDKQVATIFHAASAVRTVRLRYVSVMLAAGAAGIYQFELRKLGAATAPATGNPAITPAPYDSADPAAEATCLTLPTTAGTDALPNGPVSPTFPWNSAASATQTDPARAGEELVLFDGRPGEWGRKPLTMRAGIAEGFAVVGRCSTAISGNFTAFMEFTEEAP